MIPSSADNVTKIADNVTKIADGFGITRTALQTIQRDTPEPKFQIYHILREWMKNNPRASQEDVKMRLEILGFSEAADR